MFRYPLSGIRLNRSALQARGLVGWFPSGAGYPARTWLQHGEYQGYVHNGSFNGNAAWVLDSRFGAVLDFDDTNGTYVLVNTVFGLGAASASIALWANLDSTSESGAFLKVGAATANGYGIGVGSGTFETNGNEIIGVFENRRWIDTNTAIGTGWRHVAMTIDALGLPTFYLDGRSVGSFSGAAPYAPVTACEIGGYTYATQRFVDARITDVRLYNRLLSAADVKQIYDQPELLWLVQPKIWIASGVGTIPADPTNLAAVAGSSNRIDTTWDDNANNEDNYELQHDTNSGFPAPVSEILSSGSESHSTTGLAASTLYYFRVRATNSVGNSGWSNTASATTSAGTTLPVIMHHLKQQGIM